MNPIDGKTVRQRLHAELGALEISPAPVIAVTRRGRAIRARRRAAAGGFAAVAVAAVLVVRAVQGPAQPPVTVNAPGPGAPGGLFASGTTHGKPWRLALRNIAANPGTAWCLPAVMLNGRDGAILGIAQPRPFPVVDGGVLTDPPGQHGAGFGFERWAPDVTRVTYRLPGGQLFTQRPVALAACGQRFLMSGYSFTRAGTVRLTVYTRHGHTNVHFPLPDPAQPWPPGSQAGIWSAGATPSGTTAASGDIGGGSVAGRAWRISTALGLDGQCYSGASRGPARSTNYGRTGPGHGQSSQCVPVAAPPRTAALTPVSLPGGTAVFSGYAGLVNPRTARVVVSFSGAPDVTLRPVIVAGRAYIAFAVPPGCDVVLLRLIGASGRVFFSTAKVPPPK